MSDDPIDDEPAFRRKLVFHILDEGRAILFRDEITKLRAWVTGFKAGRSKGSGDLSVYIPGEEVLRLLLGEIDSALISKNNPQGEDDGSD